MHRRRVTITGASGQLGSALTSMLATSWEVDAWTHGQTSITDWASVRDRIAHSGPDVVIHAAAATNVDRCEVEPDWAWQVNALGTRHVSQAAAAVSAELVYVSTNYVFDGAQEQPYHEHHTPSPISVYGASKLAGELEARAATARSFIIRTAWLYAPEGHNFVNTMRRLMSERDTLTVVDDQYGNPTLASDLASAIMSIIASAPYGTYHAINAGIASWHAWASEIALLTGSDVRLDPIPGSAYPRAAQPPPNGALRSLSLPALGIELPDWRDALRRSLRA